MKKERLYSLDLLRGADIFLLMVVSHVLRACNDWHALPAWFWSWFTHPAWVGFTLYDMIMPLFIFMCGAAVPLAKPTWGHVLKRVGMLWLFGMICQGELLTYDLHRISFFNNTLQTIACGYVAAVVTMKLPKPWMRLAVPFLLTAGYTLFLHLCGDPWSMTENAAVVCEVKFLSLFYPSSEWHPVAQIAAWHYTWWATVPMFAVMGIAGALATDVLKSAREPLAKARTLALAGVGLLALGFVLLTFDPCVKHIFTASFTSLVLGVCHLLYAFCYWLADIRKVRRGTALLTLFGRHSLLAYMLGGCLVAPLAAFAGLFLDGLHLEPKLHDFIVSIVCSVMLVVVLRCYDRWCRYVRQAKAAAVG